MGLRRELLELNPGSGPRLPNENNPAGPSRPCSPLGDGGEAPWLFQDRGI